jgi:hypothetical protein
MTVAESPVNIPAINTTSSNRPASNRRNKSKNKTTASPATKSGGQSPYLLNRLAVVHAQPFALS